MQIKMHDVALHMQQAIAGVLGGIIGLVYAKKLSVKSSLLAIFISFVMSYYLGDLAAIYLKIPPQTAGFIIGLTALRLGAKIAGGDWFNLDTWLGKSGKKDGN